RRIRRTFAVAAKPVTMEQFQRFLKDRPRVKHSYTKLISPDPDGPGFAVTWFEAAQYCNWLSEKEGLPPDQWCYREPIVPGMAPRPISGAVRGCGAPPGGEWGSACGAGATTSRSYGSSLELLPRYAWFRGTIEDRRTWPVGQKRPNDLGFFDMHG